METSHFEARSHQSSLQDDLLDELDTLDADWCDHPSFFNMLQSPHSSPRAESASWEFVMEKPQVDPRYEPKKENLPEIVDLTKACPRGGACTRCHASKVKCIRTPGKADCDRCASRRWLCEPINVKRPRQHTSNSTNSTTKPKYRGRQSPQAIPEPCPITNHLPKQSPLGTVMNAVCSIVQTSTAFLSGGADKLHSVLHDKFGCTLDRYNGALWFAAFMTLKRRAAQPGPTFINASYPDALNALMTYFTRMPDYAGSNLCQRANDSLETLCLEQLLTLEQLQGSNWWIPEHIPQLKGPDAVYVTSSVLGVMSKTSNMAWDQLFRNSEELNELLESNADLLKSPLCQVSLFPLVGVLSSAEDEKLLSDKYFWTCGTDWRGTWTAGNSEVDHYDSQLDFAANCRDKYGNDMECYFRIQHCLQNCGALASRTIRCIPKPAPLKMMVQPNLEKEKCAQVTFVI